MSEKRILQTQAPAEAGVPKNLSTHVEQTHDSHDSDMSATPPHDNDKDGAGVVVPIENTEDDVKIVADRPAKWNYKRIASLVAMAFLWTGSQIPAYLLGGIPPLIYRDIGGIDRWVWFILANLLTLAAVCPFVGSLSDLFGRRYVALVGAAFLVVAMVVCGTANNMDQFIGKDCSFCLFR
ncbi:hypothetical protein FOPE_00562 [Fonsecaea pedrosoi]|nr:hypothetical protein FOPE_00562 [Fonsecaea pedrosoi]